MCSITYSFFNKLIWKEVVEISYSMLRIFFHVKSHNAFNFEFRSSLKARWRRGVTRRKSDDAINQDICISLVLHKEGTAVDRFLWFSSINHGGREMNDRPSIFQYSRTETVLRSSINYITRLCLRSRRFGWNIKICFYQLHLPLPPTLN